ncbi:CYFA0S11e01332g1_1 [Cyberlindnera fabianii]|uniref:ribonuclease III n=1 Tax=Cyberlindnera fabianii TaxID=36022 RepID=A0A061B061_CYBFA|nr:CYFA0S11e01332g1_1 [Cyberlindnera fabianii]
MGKRGSGKMEDAESKKKKPKLSEVKTDESEPYRHKIGSQEGPRTSLGLSDVLSIEHAVNNLQNALKTILEQALDIDELEAFKQKLDKDEDAAPAEVVLALLRSKLSLAAHLKTLYTKDQLPIFDQIVDFEKLKNQGLSNDSVRLDLGEQLDTTHDDEPVKRRKDGFPELPLIENPAIRARVFIHKSLVKDKLFISESEVIHAHNERLEFIGDSVLNNIMSLVVYNARPNATEGEMSQIRAKLISNVNLQRWAQAYGFHGELKMNTDDSIFKGKLKIYADVFEAYVGGLIMENPANYSKVYKWLKALAEPVIDGTEIVDFDGQVTNNPNNGNPKDKELNTNAKVELYSLIGYAGLGLHYDTIDRVINKNETMFKVQVKTKDNEILGTGVGKNTKEAGFRAAMDALDNKSIIEKFSQLRAAIPRDESKQSLNRSQKKSGSNSSGHGSKDGAWVRDESGKWVRKGSGSSSGTNLVPSSLSTSPPPPIPAATVSAPATAPPEPDASDSAAYPPQANPRKRPATSVTAASTYEASHSGHGFGDTSRPSFSSSGKSRNTGCDQSRSAR